MAFDVETIRVRSANSRMATRYKICGPFDMSNADHAAARSYVLRSYKRAVEIATKLNKG